MMDFLVQVFGSAQFIPHAVCLLWRPDLLVMHGVSDFVVALSYFAIPVLILRTVRIRPDLLNVRVARMFAAFILACGLSHVASLVTLWLPIYGLQGVIKVATAGISLYTAIQLFRLLPEFLAMPSQAQMQQRDLEIAMGREKVREVAEAKDSLSEFAYIVSHDLRAPMRGISNHATFLKEDHGDSLPPDAAKRLNRMQELCSHVEHLIATLLEFSRLGRKPGLEKVDMAKAVADVQRSLQETISEQNAEIVIDSELPQLEANPVEISTLLRNLILNGIKYNKSDPKKINIGYLPQVELEGEELLDVIYVKDNGIGIPRDFHDDIFKMFKQLHGAEDYGAGTGAGLTFVKKIIEGAGGRIRVSSEPGEGSIFYFSWSPVRDTDAGPVAA